MFSPGLPAPQTPPSPSASGLGDLFRTGSSFALGFLNLLGNQGLRDNIGQAVSTGAGLTGQLARVAAPLVQSLSQEDTQARIGSVVGSGMRLAQGVGTIATQASQQLGEGTRLAGSVIKAANDTAPLVISVRSQHI